MELQHIRELYQKFLKSTEVEILALELRQPNFFNILKIEDAELKHSNFLAWLLDPKGSHGLGETFLKKLLVELLFDELSDDINDHYLNDIDYSNIKIYREWNNIDILLKCPTKGNQNGNLIVCIENKWLSTDSPGQLERYKKIVNDNFPSETHKSIFVYLTIAGDKPKKVSGTSTYINLSYKYLFNSLDGIMKIYEENIIPKIKIYIQDYLQLIKRNYMKDEDKAIKYARKIYNEHKELLTFVMTNGLENKLSDVAEPFCSEKALKLIENKATWFSFIPKTWVESMDKLKKTDPNSRSDGYPMAFEFSKKGDDLKLQLLVYPSDQDFRKKFINNMKSVASFKARNQKAIDKSYEKDAQWTTLHSEIEKINDWSNTGEIMKGCKKLYNLEKGKVLDELINNTPDKLADFMITVPLLKDE